MDALGAVFVADQYNHRIRKISAVTKVTQTVAGSGFLSNVDGSGSSAKFTYPSGVSVSSQGDIVVADQYDHRIRKIQSSGKSVDVSSQSDDALSSVMCFCYLIFCCFGRSSCNDSRFWCHGFC